MSRKNNKQKAKQMMFAPNFPSSYETKEMIFPIFIDNKLSSKGILSSIGGVVYIDGKTLNYTNTIIADNYNKFDKIFHFSIKQHEALITGYSFISRNENLNAQYALLGSRDNKNWKIIDETNEESLSNKNKSVISKEVQSTEPYQNFILCSTNHVHLHISYFELFGIVK